MKKLFKNKIFSDAIIYTISTVVSRGISFLLIPVLTYYLTKEDYGYLGLIVSVVTILRVYIGLFPINFLLVKFSYYGKDKIAKYISNLFIIMFVTFFLVYFILYLFKGIVFANIDNGSIFILTVCVYATFSVIFRMLNTITQLEKNAKKYALLQFLWVATSLGIALILIIHYGWGWRGKFYAELFVLFLLAVYAVYYFRNNGYLVYDFDSKKIKVLVNFLFPMTFAVVGSFLMGTIDKVILARMMDIKAVGIYSISMTMAVIINIIFDSAIKSWMPHFYENLNNKNGPNMKFIIKGVLLYKLFVIFATVLYILLIPYLFHIMVDGKFNDALNYIPWLVIGFGFEGLRKALEGFMTHDDRVKTLGMINFMGAILNIILNITLIPRYGIYGAAYATMISFGVLYVVTIYYALQHKYLKQSLLGTR